MAKSSLTCGASRSPEVSNYPSPQMLCAKPTAWEHMKYHKEITFRLWYLMTKRDVLDARQLG